MLYKAKQPIYCTEKSTLKFLGTKILFQVSTEKAKSTKQKFSARIDHQNRYAR